MKGVPGYNVEFFFAVVGKQITMGLTVADGKGVVFNTLQPMLAGSVELIS